MSEIKAPEGTPLVDSSLAPIIFRNDEVRYVKADFARDLERKLQASDAKAARLEEEFNQDRQVIEQKIEFAIQLCDEKDALQAALATAQGAEARLRTALDRVCITISKCRGVPPVLKAAIELAEKALSAQPEAGAKS